MRSEKKATSSKDPVSMAADLQMLSTNNLDTSSNSLASSDTFKTMKFKSKKTLDSDVAPQGTSTLPKPAGSFKANGGIKPIATGKVASSNNMKNTSNNKRK